MINNILLVATEIPEGIESGIDKYTPLLVVVGVIAVLVVIFMVATNLNCFWCSKKFSRLSRTRVDKGNKHFCSIRCFIEHDNQISLYRCRDDHEEGTIKIFGKGGIF